MATSQGALEKSIFFQKLVLKDSRDPKQKERAKKAIEKLQAELDSLMERKTNPATKKFSPAQIAAQKLFAERARAGTLGNGKRKAAVKRKANPVTETLIYGLAPGETRDYMEELMYAGGLKLTPAEIDKVLKAAGDAGYHSFRIAGFDPTMKPDFAKAVKRNLSKSQISAASKVMAKRNPDKAMQVYTVFHRGTSNVAGTVRETSPKAAKEKIANRLGIPTLTYLVARKGERLQNPDKSKPRAYVKRASQITGAPPSKRLVSRRKMALSAPAGYFPNPSNQKLSAIDVDFLTGRKNIFGEINTPSEKKAQLEFLKNSRMTSKPVRSKYYNLTARVNRKTNPAAAMMTGYQVICMHPKKHVVGIFKTMAEAKMVATAMANAKGVPYGVKAVKVHKSHFAV